MRHIVHLDIPDFYAAIEELRHPDGKKRPLVLAEPGGRAVVQGVNGIARREGLREGMALSRAQRLCRRVLTIPPDLGFYRERNQNILDQLGDFSPLVEGTLPGHFFVDLSGTRRLWGPWPDAACRIERQLSSRQGLHARLGLGANKLVSQVAAHVMAPGDLSFVLPGGETSFLAPLPVTFLPGIGPKTAARLADLNVRQVGQLAGFSVELLSGVFGSMSNRLLRIARGIDTSPVIPFQRMPRLTVALDLDRDEIDRERLLMVLFRQVEEVGWTLRSHNRYPQAFALEIRYADGVTARRQGVLPPFAGHLDRHLFRVLRLAFDKLVQRRIAVRRLVMEFSGFVMPLRQMSLFPWEEATLAAEQRLQQALDAIRGRHGRQILFWGHGGGE
jgi:DNA polymerase-4